MTTSIELRKQNLDDVDFSLYQNKQIEIRECTTSNGINIANLNIKSIKIINCNISGKINADNINCENDFTIQNIHNDRFRGIRLCGASIGGNLQINNINTEKEKIHKSIGGNSPGRTIVATTIKVGDDLIVENIVGDINFKGANVAGEISLKKINPIDFGINLNRAKSSSVKIDADTCVKKFELTKFYYESFYIGAENTSQEISQWILTRQ